MLSKKQMKEEKKNGKIPSEMYTLPSIGINFVQTNVCKEQI